MLAHRAQITECLLREGFGLVVPGRPGRLGSILLPTKSRVPQSVQFSSATHPSLRYLFPKSALTCALIVYCYTSVMSDTGSKKQFLHAALRSNRT